MDSSDSQVVRPARGRGWVLRAVVVALAAALVVGGAFALDQTACGTLQAAVGTPSVDTYLGLATVRLQRLVAGSRS